MRGLVALCVVAGALGLRVGRGKHDATAPVSGYLMMGMANPAQKGTGLHTRLFSRAFVFVDEGGSRAAFVSLDAGMVGLALKTRALARVSEVLNSTAYTDANVVMSGTHTHSGPSGFLQHVIFQFAGSGFVRATLDAMVEGVAMSIVAAHADAEARQSPQAVSVRRGTLANASINRSPSAYLLNPATERAQYGGDTDDDMTVLAVRSGDALDAVVAWFAVHPTSLNNSNILVSGDHKGMAATLLERETRGFAAFAASNLGDVSPNILGARCRDTGLPCDFNTSACPQMNAAGAVELRTELCSGVGPGKDMFESAAIIASRQHDKAAELLGLRGAEAQATATDFAFEIASDAKVEFRHAFVKMPGLAVSDWETGEKVGVLCDAALGDGFAAGTTDGPGQFDFTQGAVSSNPLWAVASKLLHWSTPAQRACQAPKTILLPTGFMTFPHAWAPSILPVQLLKVGGLVIAAFPCELTTMAGRRVKAMLRTKFGANVEIVVAGLANEYADYTTTAEEYQQQRYEGASTVFGQHQLAAYLQETAKLADAMLAGQIVDAGPTPDDFADDCHDRTASPEAEAPPPGAAFGDVVSESWTAEAVRAGDVVIAAFVGGNLARGPGDAQSYFDVEVRNADQTWTAAYVDADFETRVESKKMHGAMLEKYHEISLRFDVPAGAAPGAYRLVYHGAALTPSKKKSKHVVHFNGTSSSFTIAA
ncbi:Neutral/alkaline nonlysosomal ceramidase [Pelagophyceae sp. CCMP2097]|nr:Neutral/alkaline nonlysosomal ceramidase [Pelagophyceae sp. CCMP2097]